MLFQRATAGQSMTICAGKNQLGLRVISFLCVLLTKGGELPFDNFSIS